MTNKTDAHVVAALVAMGLNERDRRWAQNACLVFCLKASGKQLWPWP
ncbi:hypothetical protein [Pseudomonas fluorescens]|nr:hypothetical protein [Pseudomonas fluorescens]